MNIKITCMTRHDGDTRLAGHGDIILAEQVHGNIVAPVTTRDTGRIIAGADGLVCQTNGWPVRLGVRTADCVPILAYEEASNVIAVAHAGWKGTLGNIAGVLVKHMQEAGSDPKHIHVVIGPHIGMCCYTVPQERANAFLRIFGDDQRVANRVAGVWHLDIGWANYQQLLSAGIRPENIDAPITCTSCQVDKFFSFRKDTTSSFGEQLNVIASA